MTGDPLTVAAGWATIAQLVLGLLTVLVSFVVALHRNPHEVRYTAKAVALIFLAVLLLVVPGFFIYAYSVRVARLLFGSNDQVTVAIRAISLATAVAAALGVFWGTVILPRIVRAMQAPSEGQISDVEG